MKGPSYCARDSDWMIPLILIDIPTFDIFIYIFFIFFFTFSYIFVFFSFWLGLNGKSSFDKVSHHLGG